MASPNSVESKQKETPNIVTRADVTNMEDLARYYEQSPEGERQELSNEFDRYFQEEMRKDDKLKASLEGSTESTDSVVRPVDTTKLEELYSFQSVLDKYPDLPGWVRKAAERMVYDTPKNFEGEIQYAMNNDKKIDDEKVNDEEMKS